MGSIADISSLLWQRYDSADVGFKRTYGALRKVSAGLVSAEVMWTGMIDDVIVEQRDMAMGMGARYREENALNYDPRKSRSYWVCEAILKKMQHKLAIERVAC